MNLEGCASLTNNTFYKISELTCLEYLNLNSCWRYYSEKGFDAVCQKLQKLKYLNIINSIITDKSLELLTLNNKGLEELYFGSNISSSAFKYLGKHLMHLKY